MTALTRRHRIAGCLLAGAVGDALGAPVEFDRLEDIRRKHGPRGVVDLELEPAYGRVGAITDDTQMTLFTAEGLLRARTLRAQDPAADPRRVVWRAYLRWLRTQDQPARPELEGDRGWLLDVPALNHMRAPGNTCMTALQATSGSGQIATRDHRINDSKGCGGVMRAAPAGLVGAADAFDLGCDIAALTHSHPTGFLAAGFLAFLVARILDDEPLFTATAAALERLEAEPEHEETAAAVRAAMDLAREGTPSAENVESLGEGWIAEEALAIALYAALTHPADVEGGLILAANHSGDTDSTAAITGNILGALRGPGAIPERWLREVELREEIERLAADVAVGYRPDEEWRRRYPSN